MTATNQRFTWGNDHIALDIVYGDDIPPYIESIRPIGVPASDTAFTQPQSMVQISANGAMQGNFGSRYSEMIIGNDLRYVSHEETLGEGSRTLSVTLRSERYGLRAVAQFTAYDGVAAVTGKVTVTNEGELPLRLTSVSSLSAYVRLDGDDSHWDVVTGISDWTSENRWRRERLRDYDLVSVLDIHRRNKAKAAAAAQAAASAGKKVDSRSSSVTSFGNTLTRSSVSSRSTAHDLPQAALVDPDTGRSLAWQVESNGPWLWQLGERMDGFYLVLSGPTDVEHHWHVDLKRDESFTTVTGMVAVSDRELDGVVGELTAYRRHTVRTHVDHKDLPIVFNDYMNTFMGNPTTAKELPLIEAAAKIGVEYYCIDCGWYDEHGDWWPSVGEWKESRTRFPGGLAEVIDHIRDNGMTPGIWLEPEVIGISSPYVDELPEEAFLHSGGYRLETHLRYLLDLRHPVVRRHLDETVDHLVDDLGIRYFKLDYNVNTGAGTDVDAPSRGEGQLEIDRAYLSWLDGVEDRHPEVTIETCSSGAMRADWETLKRAQLQSTSDQQDYRLYANISASSPMSMLPEQCGDWAYPNADMTIDEVRYTMINGMVGRPYVSGYLTRMSPEQLTEITAALDIYKSIRADIATAVPFWPAGLPGWRDETVALGLRSSRTRGYLAVWVRPDGAEASDEPVSLNLHGDDVDFASVRVLYGGNGDIRWDLDSHTLTVPGSTAPVAYLLELDYE
ncbi:alpha-galactosidase [Bifidobacterium simiarum]|uniref:alpha-galactosidase n=1 Tax=Bifidobacterium simiarum TaxID=2045441 RepID=A0A2M9HCS8_9BIFI|nr:alpha-galactosidase [Bifidobacterium simiarum]PJM74592.1 alpha-galactosidase [Bifidobacterium simiarum]